MFIIIGFASLVCLGAAVTAVAMRFPQKKVQTFPPVVELAQTTALPRLGFKIASLTAREATPSSTPPPTGAASPLSPAGPMPPVPFAMVSHPAPPPPGPLPPMFGAPVSPVPPVSPVSPVSPVTYAPSMGLVAPVAKSVYEVSKSPYAAPIVKGARISLPDDDEIDLPIAFRSDHPNAKAIVEAGDYADHLRIAATDGRIHLGAEAPILFGPPSD